MPSYRITFSKNLLSSDGRRFKCPQQTVAVDAASPEAALKAARRQFEQQRHLGNWRQHADEAEIADDLTNVSSRIP